MLSARALHSITGDWFPSPYDSNHELTMSNLRVKLAVRQHKAASPLLNSNFSRQARNQLNEPTRPVKNKRLQNERSDVAGPEIERLCFKSVMVSASTKRRSHSKKQRSLWCSKELLNDQERVLHKDVSRTSKAMSYFFATTTPPFDTKYKASLEVEVETADFICKL